MIFTYKKVFTDPSNTKFKLFQIAENYTQEIKSDNNRYLQFLYNGGNVEIVLFSESLERVKIDKINEINSKHNFYLNDSLYIKTCVDDIVVNFSRNVSDDFDKLIKSYNLQGVLDSAIVTIFNNNNEPKNISFADMKRIYINIVDFGSYIYYLKQIKISEVKNSQDINYIKNINYIVDCETFVPEDKYKPI